MPDGFRDTHGLGAGGGARIAFSFDSCSLWSVSVPQICLKEINLPNSIENYEDQMGTESSFNIRT